MASFFIRTYGCQMNERDSEALACLLEARGHVPADSEDTADQAERKVVGKAGLLKRLKQKRPELVLGIIGCMAQSHGRSLLDELPHVDLVCRQGKAFRTIRCFLGKVR